MTSDEIRASYLSFFESKGHKIIPSSSLIPQDDPTLLLTTAGMVPFKPYFLGRAVPPSPRLASCQKCFRATDIESVGDPTHLTFFEMLGNFSIGDYFKQESISWAWEFVTEHLKMPKECLWITILLDDDEALRYWRELGIPEKRILRLGEETNFWGPAGDSGPCGPCSEIHYDMGKTGKCEKDICLPGCDCGRFSEIWNLVFTQYNQDKNGKRTPLPKPNIDTGMGLERVAAITQSKTSVYETDLFASLLGRISKLVGKNYGDDPTTDNAMRVIAEHSRAIAFLIADGVLSSNEGRGYVLRRILRRAALFGRRLGLDQPFLAKTGLATIKQMGCIYPELKQRQDTIIKVIESEETRFEETLNTGIKLLSQIMNEADKRKKNKISGEEAFMLYDTFGFPVELTTEVAHTRNFSVDLKSFRCEMAKQKERARAAKKFSNTYLWSPKSLSQATRFVGYTKLKSKSTIREISVDNEDVDKIEVGQQASIILEATPFYGEMGGQVGDTGEIRSRTGRFTVVNTTRKLGDTPPGTIIHQGQATEGILLVGGNVQTKIDEERRRDITRNHTGTHLLQMALRQIVGRHIQQRGSLVTPDHFTFDFSHLTATTPEEIHEVQSLVNERIRQNLVVYDEELPYKEAIEQGVIALFDEKYGDIVRVLKIGRPVISAELCGGTHVTATGEIGFFHILNERSIGTGLRRIEAVTGRGAEHFINQRLLDLQKIAENLEVKPTEVVNKAQNLSATLKNERKRVQWLEGQLAKKETEAIEGKTINFRGIRIIAERVNTTNIDNLREMSDVLRNKLGNAVVVLGTDWENKPVFVANTTLADYDARQIVHIAAATTGGSGGGKKTLAQGGGTDVKRIDEALRQAVKFIKEQGEEGRHAQPRT